MTSDGQPDPAGDPLPDQPDAPAATPADGDEAGPEELVRLVVPATPRRPDVDPEDWKSSGGSDDDRYLRERPPHW